MLEQGESSQDDARKSRQSVGLATVTERGWAANFGGDSILVVAQPGKLQVAQRFVHQSDLPTLTKKPKMKLTLCTFAALTGTAFLRRRTQNRKSRRAPIA